ncbi:MAG: cytochrome P450 [Acidimicrobiales bacterium]|nr:cytochrome P450 [Acidimicrobiales bacterium]
MPNAPTTSLTVEEINLSSPEFWLLPHDERDAAFAKLRTERPVAFFPELGFEDIPPGPGYWALTRHDDIWHVSRNPQLFCSGRGTNIGDMPTELNEFFGSMINMDDPKHARLRRLVQRGFTPRHIEQIELDLRRRAQAIVAGIADRGECDFVSEIAAALPLQVICDMMGIPAAHYQRIFELTNLILGVGDPEYVTSLQELMAAGLELFQYAQELGRDRLADPTDDITSALMHADVDGDRLTAQEFGSFFILLVVAGNETTRNAISHGMKALTDHPDQRQVLVDDFESVIPTAVEEIVRWATPVIHFRRTATADTEIGGVPIKEGDKVVMFYNSANRDEAAFPDPFRFDVRRTPNEQTGFGAGGPHFCLGANLARREITVMFDELLHGLPDIAVTSEPDYLQSAFIHGIKRMRASWTPR